MKYPEYGLAVDDVFHAIMDNVPMLSSPDASALAEEVVTALADNGWFREMDLCEYGNPTRTIDCERPTRPGERYCAEHQG